MPRAEQPIVHTTRRLGWRVRRTLRSQFQPLLGSRSARYWKRSRDRFKGRIGFVLGNGPSLPVDRLELLSEHITLAANRIDLAFGSTPWRSRFVSIIDPQVAGRMAPHIARNHRRVFVGPEIAVPMPGCRQISWRHLGRPTVDPVGDDIMFSSDVSKGLYAGYSVTYANLQIAAHFGLDPIILLGCDHRYEGEVGANPRSVIRAGKDQNHFDERYRLEGELVRPAPLSLMTIAFRHARAWADSTGCRILNATPGSKLDVFERASLTDVLAEAGRSESTH